MQTFSLPPTSLTEEERRKTERIDGRIFNALVNAGITDRWSWACDQQKNPRRIEFLFLIPNSRPLVTFAPDRFLALTDEEVIAQIERAIARLP